MVYHNSSSNKFSASLQWQPRRLIVINRHVAQAGKRTIVNGTYNPNHDKRIIQSEFTITMRRK